MDKQIVTLDALRSTRPRRDPMPSCRFVYKQMPFQQAHVLNPVQVWLQKKKHVDFKHYLLIWPAANAE